MFISVNHIPVKAGREEDFEKMFRERDRAVETQPGFVSLDILKPGSRAIRGGGSEPIGNNEYQVLTRWVDEAAFRGWVTSDAFRKSHSRIVDDTVFDGKSYLTYHHTVEGAGANAPAPMGVPTTL